MGKIQFYERTHKYINLETKEEYTSVSHVLKKFKEEFNVELMSALYAKKHGLEQKDVKKAWEDNKNFACTRGTAFHKALEEFIKEGKVDKDYAKVIASFQQVVEANVFKIQNVESEILLYNDEYKVAGQSDICWWHEDGTFTIGDFKTNKAFRFDSKFGKWLKYPLNHLSECEFNSYTMQLSLYALMNEILTGKQCRGLLILWLDADKGEWTPIRCNYMKHEAILTLMEFERLNRGNE